MWYAINERDDVRTEMYASEEELISHLREVSTERDFWDVYCTSQNGIQYYW